MLHRYLLCFWLFPETRDKTLPDCWCYVDAETLDLAIVRAMEGYGVSRVEDVCWCEFSLLDATKELGNGWRHWVTLDNPSGRYGR
jgi:hypothetical protein